MRAWLGWLGSMALAVASCSDTEKQQDCTAIGCTDGVHVSVLTGPLEDGDYTLRVTFDGDAYECTLSAPGDLPAPGNGHALSCSPELRSALVISRSSCNDTACPPTGPLEWSFTPEGFPENVAVKLERGGETLAEAERAIEYHQIYPNGPDCDPGCKSSGVEFLFD